MRLTSKVTPLQQPKNRPSTNFTSIQNQFYHSNTRTQSNQRNQPYMIKSNYQPKLETNNQINLIKYINQQNITTRISTNHVYDSQKQDNVNRRLQDWKILTLKQLKRSKVNKNGEGEESGRNRSKNKRYLSLSKDHDASRSKEKNNNSINNVNFDEKKEYKCLRSLQKRRHIIDRVQQTIQLNSHSASIFCD